MPNRSFLFVVQSVLIIGTVMVAVLVFPWDRVFRVAESPPAIERLNQPRPHEPVPQVKREKKMPVYHVGPCDDCCQDEECCSPTPCLDLLVTFADAGALNGQYLAEWDTGNNRWIFSIGACDWEVVATGSTGGFSFLRPIGHACELTGECAGSSGVSTVTITPDDDQCDFCGAGDLIGATITVQWSCCYPEYFTLVDFSPSSTGSCDCSVYGELEIPVLCGGSTPPEVIGYGFTPPPQDFPCTLTTIGIFFECRGELKVRISESNGPSEEVDYVLNNVSLSELNAGTPITLPRVYIRPGAQCDWPDEITIQGHNCGNWCDE